MKKIIAIILITMMGGAAMATLSWAYGSDLRDFDSGMSAGWLVQMYQDNGDVTTLSAITGFGDNTGLVIGDATSLTDVLLGGYTGTLQAAARGGDISWGEVFGAWASLYGEDVYSVVYNAANIADATQAIVIDSSAFTLAASDPGVYSVSSVNNSWVAVPEPATALLFGIGGLGAFVIRRNKRKAQEEADA